MSKPPLPGGALERAVMKTVWQLGGVMAREVHDTVSDQRTYMTIANVLDQVLWLPGVLR